MSVPIVAYKSNTTQRLSAPTATADPDLVLSLAANTTYRIRGTIIQRASAICSLVHGFSSGGVAIPYVAGMWYNRSNEMEAVVGATGSVNNGLGVITSNDLLTGYTAGFSGKGDASTYVDYYNYTEVQFFLTTSAAVDLSYIWGQYASSGTAPAEVIAGSTLFAEALTPGDKRQWAVRSAELTRTPSAALIPDPDLTLTLEPDTDYWYEGLLLGFTTRWYASGMHASVNYDGGVANTPRVASQRVWRVPCTYALNVSTQPGAAIWPGPNAVTDPTTSVRVWNNVGSARTDLRGGFWTEGHLRTDATGGTICWNWRHVSLEGYGRYSTAHIGSYLVVEKLNPCVF